MAVFGNPYAETSMRLGPIWSRNPYERLPISNKMSTTGGEAQGEDDTQALLQESDPDQAQAQCSRKAIPAYRDFLTELRIRSMIGYCMMYDQSDQYGNWAFRSLIASSVLMGVAAGGLSQYIPVGDGWFPWISKMTIGIITATIGTFKAGSTLLYEKFEKKHELFNKTGAGWQELELKIRHFLDVSEDTVNIEKYEQFTKDCIKQRGEICCMAKPERGIYKEYNENFKRHVVDRYIKKQKTVAGILDELKKRENEFCDKEPRDVLTI